MLARASSQIQQEIAETLREIDGHFRELARRTKQAREISGASEDIQACIEELKDSKTTLQRHRVQLRKWVSELGSKHEMKGKLGATRTRIEQELQGITVLENGLKERVASVQSVDAGSERSCGPPETSAASARECGERESQAPVLCEQEFKVLSCQLVAGGDLSDEFVCKVCLDVVGCDPKLTRCAHLFCGDCLSKWFVAQPGNQTWAQRAHSGGLVPCPVCKEPLHEDRDLFSVCQGGQNGSGFLWSMLQQTKIRCANHSACRPNGACDWIGEYGAYQMHIRSCDNTPIFARRNEDPAVTTMDLLESVQGTVVPEKVRCDSAASASTLSDLLVLDNTEASSEGEFVEDAPSSSEDDVLAEELAGDDHAEVDGEDAATNESLLGSISALFDLKIKAQERKSAQKDHVPDSKTWCSQVIQPETQQQKPPQQQQLPKTKKQQRQTQAAEDSRKNKLAFLQHQLLEQQRQHSLMAASRAHQIAQWQHAQVAHAQVAHRAYAAQWQAAQLQSAYARQWQAAYATHAAMAANGVKRCN